MSDDVDLAVVRHHLYCKVYGTLEELRDGSEGDVRVELEEAMHAVDALYMLAGRRTVGYVDGDPE